jgi:hypothetical protein
MVASKKTGGEKTKAKNELKITAATKPLHLTKKERQALAKALKTAGETFVESLESKEKLTTVIGGDVPWDD